LRYVEAELGNFYALILTRSAFQAISATVEAAEAHTRGLKSLIDLFGGLEALDHMTLSKVYQYEHPKPILSHS
jgi:hypothetical protein